MIQRKVKVIAGDMGGYKLNKIPRIANNIWALITQATREVYERTAFWSIAEVALRYPGEKTEEKYLVLVREIGEGFSLILKYTAFVFS